MVTHFYNALRYVHRDVLKRVKLYLGTGDETVEDNSDDDDDATITSADDAKNETLFLFRFKSYVCDDSNDREREFEQDVDDTSLDRITDIIEDCDGDFFDRFYREIMTMPIVDV